MDRHLHASFRAPPPPHLAPPPRWSSTASPSSAPGNLVWGHGRSEPRSVRGPRRAPTRMTVPYGRIRGAGKLGPEGPLRAPAPAGTSPSGLALSAVVPGDFPQSWGLRVCGPPCVCSGGVSRPCPTCSGDASSGEFVEELEGPRRGKNFARSSAHRLELAQQFCRLGDVEAHPLGGAQEVARVASGGASACRWAATTIAETC